MKKNHKKFALYLTMLSVFVLLSAAPRNAVAMTIFIDRPATEARVGDTIAIGVMIDTDNKEINALEGTIEVSGPTEIVSISTGGSIFPLWPNKPSFLGNEITFVGGTPSGVYGSKLRLFTIFMKPSGEGEITLKLKSATAYLNDGFGTQISLPQNSENISVLTGGGEVKNNLDSMILLDKNPPLSFTVELGRDQFSYDNKYFISFYSSDAESGISQYEVTEGDFGTVRSGNIYVLRDQSLKSAISVKAVDNAGNARTEQMIIGGNDKLWILYLLSSLVFFFFVFYLKIRYNKNKKRL